jgi:hypothetical protein
MQTFLELPWVKSVLYSVQPLSHYSSNDNWTKASRGTEGGKEDMTVNDKSGTVRLTNCYDRRRDEPIHSWDTNKDERGKSNMSLSIYEDIKSSIPKLNIKVINGFCRRGIHHPECVGYWSGSTLELRCLCACHSLKYKERKKLADVSNAQLEQTNSHAITEVTL